MIVSLDTNVLIDLWNNTMQGQQNASTLNLLRLSGVELVVCGVVYVELHAHPSITKALLQAELRWLDIRVDSVTTALMWDEVARAHQDASQRRRKSGNLLFRRPLPDHLIGAYAQYRADALLTLNVADFSDFSALKVLPA